ncbi:MAG: ATP-binding protein [Pedobacter sp.]|nr:MAG: ATP-binding protein [Pedobacter sp.]
MQSKTNQISQLTELNEELENYFSNTIIPQLFIDADLRLRKFTPPAMKQFKLKDEFIGKPLADIAENFRYPTIIENITSVIETGEILEKEIQTTDMYWYQMNILPYIIKKENRTNGVIITFVDVTPRIRDLKEQERLIADHELLLDTIAHDIKNPINALGLTVELIKKLSETQMERFPKLLGKLESSLTNMKKVVDGLMDTRLQRHRYQASEELLDLQNIIEDVRLTLAPQIQERRAKIKLNLIDTELTFVRRKLRSVIYNLLSNAIKYTPFDRQPEITIGSKIEDDNMVISLSDNGIGISSADQKSIFEKFERVRSDVEGTGVGLYLVNTIVSSSGGAIAVESELGKGSCFKIMLKIQGSAN